MIVWEFGTVADGPADEDPAAEARRIQAQAPRWSVWWGPRCRRFFAVPRQGVPLLLEATRARELGARLTGRPWT